MPDIVLSASSDQANLSGGASNALDWAQVVLLLVLAVKLHSDLPACWLLQTMGFVALNKVRQWVGWDGALACCPTALNFLYYSCDLHPAFASLG